MSVGSKVTRVRGVLVGVSVGVDCDTVSSLPLLYRTVAPPMQDNAVTHEFGLNWIDIGFRFGIYMRILLH